MRDFDLEAIRAHQAAARAARAAQNLDLDDEPRYDAAAIADCGMCDKDGYRGLSVCDHVDYRPAYTAGMAKVRAALAQKRIPTTPQEGTP